jgi:hypothetical protein
LRAINSNWIKSIEIIKKEINGVTTSNPARIYIKLKWKNEKRFLRTFIKNG